MTSPARVVPALDARRRGLARESVCPGALDLPNDGRDALASESIEEEVENFRFQEIPNDE